MCVGDGEVEGEEEVEAPELPLGAPAVALRAPVRVREVVAERVGAALGLAGEALALALPVGVAEDTASCVKVGVAWEEAVGGEEALAQALAGALAVALLLRAPVALPRREGVALPVAQGLGLGLGL